MHILHVVGARPNFMKAAPVVRALPEYSTLRQTIVHTGQHYDANMSDVFFQQLAIPAPDVNLQVGSGSHAQQTAEIISRFEPVVLERKPDLVLVYGDVNSTVAAALVCVKLLVKVGHVEAGLRAFDRTMPEEINRLLTDQLSDLLFTPSKDGNENLAREGIAPEKVHFVGNVMIDTLIRMLPVARQQIPQDLPERYVLVTLHRPSNVDDLGWLAEMVTALREIASDVPVVFPVHPRTRKKLADAGLQADGLRIIDPLPYVEFVGSQTRAALVITDSGGIQEETTYLGVPCITVRDNTERPITVEMGTNHLVGRSIDRIRSAAYEILNGSKKDAAIPPLWDGHAAERIAAVIAAGRF
jgi:UDP-N-acetylglucosamine 2-epimerase (non-hydrolysing)